jgi:hypothetical protein
VVTTVPLTFSRPAKLNHTDTVSYEIYMLRHAINRLVKQELTDRDAWVYLEAFLLHYRNLLQFLGKENPSATDLNVTTIWQLEGLPVPENLNQIHAGGKILLAKYEPPDSQGGGRISQYLQHCTTKRIEAKDWEVATMLNEIEPLLRELEKSLVTTPGILAAVPAVPTLDYFSASTTVGTHTAVAVVISEDPLKKPKDFE